MEKRILTHYQNFKFKDAYWELEDSARREVLDGLLKDIEGASDQVYFYQVYPSRSEYDLLAWSTVDAGEVQAPALFFDRFAKSVNPYRKYVDMADNFWGMTRPSIYSKSKRSPQEIDPFNPDDRTMYFIIYPFVKTIPWYLESGEERMRMMRGHIQLGKQYKEITQLLLYSFGLQDQEFIVSYETGDLAQFSDLVYDLRATEARKYTERDTPIITGIIKTRDELVDIFA